MSWLRSKIPLFLGMGAAAAFMNWRFQFGGNIEPGNSRSDDNSASNSIKSLLPGQSPNVEKDFKKYGAEAGAKIDDVLSEADKQAARLKNNTEAYAKDVKIEAMKAVDKFDQKVEDGAAKAKSGISSWFGGSSK